MNMLSIKQKLHHYLETANDKKLKALYTMVEDEIEHSGVTFSEELKAELESRHQGYLDGTEQLISVEESKRRINKLLKTGRK
jgi:hypothetical protein